MKEKFSNFAKRLKSENEAVKDWQKNRPKTPIGDKLFFFFHALIVVAFVVVFILSNPLSSSAAELPPNVPTTNGGEIPTDLTGYTVTVPAGFTSTSGYDSFYLDGYFTIENLGIYQGSLSEFYVGYADNGLPESNRVMFVPAYVDTHNSFSLTITGGLDVSNSRLIQWLDNNNATFTPSSTPPSDTTVTFKSGLYNLAGNWYLTDLNFIASLDGFEFETLGGDIVDAWDIIDNKLYAYLNYDYDNPLLVAEYFGDGRVEWYTRECSFLWKLYDDNVSSSFLSSLSSFLLFDANVSSEDGFYLMQDAFHFGILDGFDVGYDTGYSKGFEEGVGISPEEGDTFLGNIVANILDALDNFTIVGSFSFLDLIKVLVGAFVLLFFLKLLAGG